VKGPLGTRRDIAGSVTRPLVAALAKTPITPNALTWAGLAIAIVAAVLIGTGHLFAAGFVVLGGSLFDMLDGALARGTGRISRFGAILDSTLDRGSEAVVLIGLLAFYASSGSAATGPVAGVVAVGLVWLTSLLVSYIRARAEATQLDCEVGVFTRAERVFLLVLGLLLSSLGSALIIILWIIAGLSLVTVVQRLHHVWRETIKG
jgi:CDP-diacylglycerol--glycerol-3-phosphate 3-phosphatidyltransferase